MTRPLADVRILVADDQPDVARTLCRSVERAGARLYFVDSGTAALATACDMPYDLMIVDLKMPPDDWGGLWLLERLEAEEIRVPTVVLSGEGAREQIKYAMRLGATDWVDKDDAGTELLDRCTTAHSKRQARALQDAIAQLPTPLARHFERYSRATDVDRQVNAGLATLEAILRFTAVIGLATTPPAPLGGVSAVQLARPTLGTWLTVCTQLRNAADAGHEFIRLLACLIPDRSTQQVQEIINLRNGIAHGRTTPTSVHADELDRLLRPFAARAAAFWGASIGVATAMTFDGTTFRADFHQLRGPGGPTPHTMVTAEPTLTGQLFLVPHNGAPVTLSPWLIAEQAPGSETYRCFQFDGSDTRPTSSSPLRYANAGDPADPNRPSTIASWRTAETWVQ